MPPRPKSPGRLSCLSGAKYSRNTPQQECSGPQFARNAPVSAHMRPWWRCVLPGRAQVPPGPLRGVKRRNGAASRLELRRAPEPTCEVPGRRRAQERGARMKWKVYEHVLEMNRGFEQVRTSLQALAKYPGLQRGEIRRFEQLARENCAATNS